MALVSMTGFGRGEMSAGGIRVEVELGSVNRKQFDLHVNVPRTLAAHEARLYELVHRAIPRGAVTGSIRISVSGKALKDCVSVDGDRAEAYIARLARTARRLRLKNDLTASVLVHLPDVVRSEAPERDSTRVWPLIEKALAKSIGRLLDMKRVEGRAIEKDLGPRLRKLRAVLTRIKGLAPTVARAYRRGMETRLREAGFDVSRADPQVLKEVALFGERTDISEEMVRLQSHLDQADTLLVSRAPCGRPFDFLCQEMLREINTIGSKANSADITKQVISFKTELESVREQIQNVE